MPSMTQASRRKYTKYLLEDAQAHLAAGNISQHLYDQYVEIIASYTPRQLFVAYCGAQEVNGRAAAKAVANA